MSLEIGNKTISLPLIHNLDLGAGVIIENVLNNIPKVSVEVEYEVVDHYGKQFQFRKILIKTNDRSFDLFELFPNVPIFVNNLNPRFFNGKVGTPELRTIEDVMTLLHEVGHFFQSREKVFEFLEESKTLAGVIVYLSQNNLLPNDLAELESASFELFGSNQTFAPFDSEYQSLVGKNTKLYDLWSGHVNEIKKIMKERDASLRALAWTKELMDKIFVDIGNFIINDDQIMLREYNELQLSSHVKRNVYSGKKLIIKWLDGYRKFFKLEGNLRANLKQISERVRARL